MADVVIVDDSADTGRALRSLFRIAGHTARCLDGGRAALDYLTGPDTAGHAPSLVLLDWMMPDVGGADVLRGIRRDPRLANIPVVIYTALSDDSTRVEAEQLGATAVVTKAGGWETLYSRLRPYLA